MKKVFYLKTCGTCTKILAKLDLPDWELREIKKDPITAEELEQCMRKPNRTKHFSAKDQPR